MALRLALLAMLVGLLAAALPTAYAAATTQYEYDSMQRLTRVTRPDGTTVDYVYDLLGNRLMKTTTLPGGWSNQPPSAVTNPSPANGTTNVSTTATLSWSPAADPDSGDSVVYSIYFGTSPTPPLTFIGEPSNWTPGKLRGWTTYYWQIVSRDSRNAQTASPVWRFTTSNAPPVADFVASVCGGWAPLVVNFTDRSYDTDNAIVSWEWDLDNDGTVDATNRNPTFTYSNPGDYAVTLTVHDESGAANSIVRSNVISDGGSTDIGFNPGADQYVYAMAEQADGKILVGGAFTNLAGLMRNYLGRLNADGTVDSGFNPGANNWVSALAVQPDGKLLVAGEFTTIGGQAHARIARLNADGTVDSEFNPAANNSVRSLAVQADGKILAWGAFTALGGLGRNYLGRLNSDGTVDNGFNPGANGSVYALVMQADGKIMVGGSFTALGGQTCNNLGRLNADGTLDRGFDPVPSGLVYGIDPGPDSHVGSLALQADGRVLVGGVVSSRDGHGYYYLSRLNVDGKVDCWFNPNVWGGAVSSLAVQADGKILMGGNFNTVGGQYRQQIARLNPAGEVDIGINLEVGGSVASMAVQADGKILVGGYFITLGGKTRMYLGRLNNAPATQNITYDGSTFTWLRGGSAPEVGRTTFEHTLDGTNWTSLGDGLRIAGGWQLNDIVLSTIGWVRARGFLTGGGWNASAWFVETGYGRPAFVTQPTSRANDAGTTATFGVMTRGSEPLSFQWRKDGVALLDGSAIAGATTATLTITNVLGGDAGGYSVVASNAFGSVTSSVAMLTIVDPVITVQPASQSRELGQSVTFSVTAAGTAPLDYQWLKQGVPLAQGTAAALTLTNLQGTDAGNYTVVASSPYGSVTSVVALLTVNWAAVEGGFSPGANGPVLSLAVQEDGKVLVGGYFSALGGQPRSRIGRLNADGTVDSGFNPVADNGVGSLAIQADGKILVGGTFTSLGGQTRNYLGRLNADGTVDRGFTNGASDYVESLAVQADGKIIVAGRFTTLGGLPRNRIARLNTDGSLDNEFNPGANSYVYSLAFQADGKILVGGSFTTLGGQARNGIARLNADGTVDSGFNPGVGGSVYSLAVQADGKILVGGYFTTLGGQTCNMIGRLNANGTVDNGFNPGGNNSVNSLAVQADGKILVGGNFTTLGGQVRNYLGRLNADGTVDTGFNVGANSYVDSLAVQAEGKILVGGSFATLGGQAHNNIGRLNNSGSATQSLTYDSSTFTWLRGGTGPEVWRATFELSTNGADWTTLGEGTRISGGWQRTNASLAPGGTLRARGYVAGGHQNACGWFVESGYGMPAFNWQPASRTNGAGTTATFGVVVGGSESFGFQWRKNGVALLDGGNIAGTTTATLMITNLLGGDAGGYSVVVTNAFGSVTSAVATLTMVDPVITVQPVSQSRELGQSVTFAATAVGTMPIGYQWWKEGVVLEQRTAASLTLTNLQRTDAGNYTVVVSSSFGSVTSTVALLTVNMAPVEGAFNPGANNEVSSLAMQPDGKILVGGGFTILGGQTCSMIARLNVDGTVDSGFSPGANGPVSSLAVQADGKVLVGGYFSALGGQPRSRIGRLNADGTVDSGFNPVADDGVVSLAVQADGKILVGGSFTTLGGQPRNCLGRLNVDGTVDSGFSSGAGGTFPSVYSLMVQPDGRILVAGHFTTLGGQTRNYLGRLNGDGTVESGFNPGANNNVRSLAVQADGKILVGGGFTMLGGQTRNMIARLNEDGTVDSGFNPGASGDVTSLAAQADGKILVGGYFGTLGGQTRRYLGRLIADGTVDSGFNPGANSYVSSLAVQADGKILVGGGFTTLGGLTRNRIGRLNNSEPATQSLAYYGSVVTWLRGGTSPEVWYTSFEVSTNGTDWVTLGEGTRIVGGWRSVGASLASGSTVRARGWVAGGYQNGSGWFVESLASISAPMRLGIVRDGSYTLLSWTGGLGPYQVQQTTNLGNPNAWANLGTPMQTNSISIPVGSGTKFLRVRGQ